MTETARTRLPALAENYWAESRRPLVSLVFIAPLLVTYELGVLAFHIQNGADAWMRRSLNLMGFSQHFLLPILTVCALLAWHHLSREPWRFSRKVIWGMAVECVLLALCLQLIYQVQREVVATEIAVQWSPRCNIFGDAVGYLGAGIYEELLFRLILLSLVTWGFRQSGLELRTSTILGVVVSSLIFSAAHHVGPAGEPLEWFKFSFRFLAGVFFAILFLYRGFGIAAGTHAGYDILVGLFH
jgi:membrane protease YdiL (CAAX protease family)